MASSVAVVDASVFRFGSTTQKAEFVKTVGQAFQAGGYVRLVGHGIDADLCAQTYRAADQLFALPAATKSRYCVPGGMTGYLLVPQGGDYNNDEMEMWHISAESCPRGASAALYPPNFWPEELPDFKPPSQKLYAHLLASSEVILEACALYLDLPAHSLTDVVDHGWSTLRYMRYPKQPATAVPGEVRTKAHQDISLLTFLSAGSADGLEVLIGSEWLPVTGKPEEYLVGGGKMLQRLTAGQLKGATHRVLYPAKASGERIAMPFFVSPRPDIPLVPIHPRLRDESRQFTAISTADFLVRELGLGQALD